jgi:hypothetical protein
MEQNVNNRQTNSKETVKPTTGRCSWALSWTECQVMRAFAILAIMLHNYCHWLNPIVKENEYQYIQHNVDWLLQVLSHPDLLLPVHLLSFFGHYGVPVFLFLSAYGLEQKYGKHRLPPTADSGSTGATNGNASASGRKEPTAWAFIRYHYLKLFKMMVVGFICFIIIDRLTPGPWHYNVLQIVAQLGMFNNLLPDPDHQIWPGPFWFFGLMLQLYIIYRLFIYRRSSAWTIALMVVCVGIQLLLDPESDAMNQYRYNSTGGMLPFGLGILYARHLKGGTSRGIMLAVFALCTLLMFGMSLDAILWTFVPVFICLGAVTLVKVLPGALMPSLQWLGAISSAIYIIHPTLRKIFIPISRGGDIYTGLLLYIIATIGVAWLTKQLMKKIPNPKLQ